MKIRLANENEIDRIMPLYAQAVEFMKSTGNPTQWKTIPEKSIILEYITQKMQYICEDNGEIIATFMFHIGNDPTYDIIYDGKWLNDETYGVIHKITSNKKGAGTACLEFCYELCKNIRIDTHDNNKPLQNLLKKLGYKYCGIILLENGEERLAFQKE